MTDTEIMKFCQNHWRLYRTYTLYKSVAAFYLLTDSSVLDSCQGFMIQQRRECKKHEMAPV